MNRTKLAVLASFLTAASGQAATIYVSTCGNNANSGATASCVGATGAKATIAGAVAASAPGDTILVLPGVHIAGINLPPRQLTIRSTAGAAQTTITGGSGSQPIIGVTSTLAAGTIIEGFTFTGGNVTSAGGGGAIRSATTLDIRSCVFTDNSCVGNGGAIAVTAGGLTLTDCIVEDNASTSGGMVSVYNDTFTINRCTFRNAPFGALNVVDAVVVIADSVFADNNGGQSSAMSAVRGSVTVDRCWFGDNTSNNGAAVALITFTNPPQVAHFRNCVFEHNTSNANGGAITAAGNVNAFVDHCTFYENSSGGPTWAASLDASGIGTFTVRNSILLDTAGPSIMVDASGSDVSHCFLGAPWSGSGSNNTVTIDPGFIDAVEDDFRLRGDSPALGAADPFNTPTLDYLRLPRTVGLSCAGDGPDAGAFETQAYDLDDNSTPDFCQIIADSSLDCSRNFILDSAETGPFPHIAIQNFTGSPQRALGAPDDLYNAIGANPITLDFGDRPIANLDGPDLTVYEVDFGTAEFGVIDVLVSDDGMDFRSVKATETAAIAIPGAEAHGNAAYARSYDLGPANLSQARYVRIQPLSAGISGAGDGFDLDAIGAVHQVALPECPSFCIGDTNGDNVIDFADLNNVLSAYNTTGAELPGDVDDDGDVDFADLNMVLSVYNTPCL